LSNTVFIVDDDPSILKSLSRLLSTQNYDVIPYSSAIRFLESIPIPHPSCLILDIFMPELDGLKLQKKLTSLDSKPPIIFLTGKGDISMTVQAMKAGAFDFLEKPIDSQLLINTVNKALEHDAVTNREQIKIARIFTKYQSLSTREQQVFSLVTSGKLNKQVAFELGISEKTVKVHRAHVMKKMKVDSIAELARLREKINI